jgi:DNA glycosylase AlkZ-like
MPVSNAVSALAQRLGAQLLAGTPARDPAEVAGRLLALQAQDLQGARLAIRARTSRLTSARIDRAFTTERSIVITWLNRGTLHLVRSDDYAWLHSLTTPAFVSMNARRLREEGVSAKAAEKGAAIIKRSLAGDGPLTREQLGERLRAAKVPVAGQALVHLLLLASLRGLVVRGPMVGGQHAFVLTQDWLGETKPIERDLALAELALRYLAGHGPATDRDLAYWSGLPLRDARAGLKSIGSEVVERGDGQLSLKRSKATSALPPPRLLGSFDPVLFGWTSREPVLGAGAKDVVAGGVFRPFAMVRGQAVATWAIRTGEVRLKPFRKLSQRDAAALKADARDVLRFLGLN